MIARVVPSFATIAAMLVIGGCFETHNPMNQAVDQTDCYTCHVPEYNATGTTAFPTAPPHQTSGCSTDCVQCHTTVLWNNGLGGCNHPETAFPLATQGTMHATVTCIQCHSAEITTATGATSVKGANTDCIACHTNTTAQQQGHVGVFYSNGTLVGQPYAYSTTDHRFCLDCHPTGLPVRHGPGNPFVLPHHNARCATCHDNASGLGHVGGADVLCVTSGCHNGSHNKDTNHHPGCLKSGCHPDGQTHGG